MKNRKFALTLALEENQELMDDIDSLIRERAKAIVREEAEKMLGGSIQEEARRVAEKKIEAMSSFDFKSHVRAAVRDVIVWDDELRNSVKAAVQDWMNSSSYTINCHIQDYVNRALSHVVQADIIKAVSDALTKR